MSDETKTESVYEWANKAFVDLLRLFPYIPDDKIQTLEDAIDAGVKAEKRAEYWERTSIWYQKDASLWEKRATEEEKRAETAERERDEARARADKLEEALKAIGEHEECDRCGCACDKPAARAALDSLK
jgi:hypothetical protein